MDLKRLGTTGAIAGVILLAFGGFGSLLYPGMRGWVVALLAGGALLLFAGYMHLDAIAKRLARRQTKYGLNVLLMVVLLLAVIALVEYFSVSYNKRVDLTEGRRYTLSSQTVKLVKDLKKPVKAVAFYRAPGSGVYEDRRSAEDLLRQIADLSANFRYEFADPDRDPGMARRYKISMYGTVVLETPEDAPASGAATPAAPAKQTEETPAKAAPGEGKAAKTAQTAAAKKAAPGAAVAEQAMREEQITDLSEERLTNTLLKITRPGRRNIYFVQGHGEGNLTESGRSGFGLLRQEVEKANYVVKDLFLPREKAVPDDAAAVVILGPQKELAPEELGILEAYIARGGKLLVLVDPYTAASLKPFLEKYGLKLADDVVVDRLQHAFGGNLLTPVVNRYTDHPITRDLKGTATIFPFVRSVDVAEKAPEGITLEKLAESGPFDGSWAETDRSEFTRGSIQFNEGKDRKGPVPLAVAATIARKPAAPAGADPATKKAGEPAKAGEEKAAGPAKKSDENMPEAAEERRESKARVVVFGSSAVASNVYLGAFGNRDLIMNAVSWLADEDDLIAIRPKDPKSSPLFLTSAQANLFWVVPVVLMPLGIVVAGVGVFVRRRRGQ